MRMNRGHEKKVHDAQGERSKMKKIDNQQRVWMLIGERGNFTFPQLQKATGLCRQSLAKILRELEKNGMIVKDTVKPWEKFEHLKIFDGFLGASMQALMQSSTNELTDTRSAVEAWFLRLVSVKPQHVGEVVYRIAKT